MSIVPVADNEILYRRIPCIEGLYVIQADGTVKVSPLLFLIVPLDRQLIVQNYATMTLKKPSMTH